MGFYRIMMKRTINKFCYNIYNIKSQLFKIEKNKMCAKKLIQDNCVKLIYRVTKTTGKNVFYLKRINV